MSSAYGWSYAIKLNKEGKRKNYTKKNRYQKKISGSVNQYMHPQKLAAPDLPFLNKTGRIIIAGALIVISVTVMVKEPRLHSVVVKQISGWISAIGPAANEKKSVNKKVIKAKKIETPVLISEEVTQTIVQAAPMALISDQGLFLMDINGRVWPLAYDQSAAVLPVITGVEVKEMPGNMGIVLKSNINNQLVLSILKQSFSEQISELHFLNQELVLYTRDGIKVKMQQGSRFGKDLIRLTSVLEDIRIKNKKIEIIDMRYAKHIVVRPLSRR